MKPYLKKIILDIPIVPTVTAKVSFKNFSKNKSFDQNLFKIPSDYTEEESVLDKILNKEKNKSPPRGADTTN